LHCRRRTGVLGAIFRPGWVVREEAEATRRGTELLALFGDRLLPRIAWPARSLSYANRRRLEIARALATNPRLLLLDEPTAGMSAQETRESIHLIERIARERGLTLLFTEHDMEVVFAIAHRITVLHQGEVIADGTPEEVRAHAEVRRVYLGERR